MVEVRHEKPVQVLREEPVCSRFDEVFGERRPSIGRRRNPRWGVGVGGSVAAPRTVNGVGRTAVMAAIADMTAATASAVC
jgi:hypothetical protein